MPRGRISIHVSTVDVGGAANGHNFVMEVCEVDVKGSPLQGICSHLQLEPQELHRSNPPNPYRPSLQGSSHLALDEIRQTLRYEARMLSYAVLKYSWMAIHYGIQLIVWMRYHLNSKVLSRVSAAPILALASHLLSHLADEHI